VVLLVPFPLWTVTATSLASPQDVIANGGWVVWPERITLGAYREILSGGIVTRALVVSTGITVVGTALSLTCTVLLAYALSRPGVYGGRPVLLLILFTFLFPPGMIPLFLVVRTTGLFDQYAALILPFLVNVFNLVVMRGFFQSIPADLIEAARFDGAGDLTILWRVVLPLSKAVLAVIGLCYAVGYQPTGQPVRSAVSTEVDRGRRPRHRGRAVARRLRRRITGRRCQQRRHGPRALAQLRPVRRAAPGRAGR
jgi:putative aldouronate transport system permease protein